ncbi:MAG: LPS assembly lipoprotein LptE [Desulfobacterales bacterium]|jgi:outer membrane lipopolysaccharide assembly protein LptE/RlpB|nr:LPS assembly lipoprotein LptE [Desulfobacterales bacterium]
MRPSRPNSVFLAACALVGTLLLGAACGYRFQSAGKIPEGLEPIFIDVFENRTGEAGLEVTVTNAVVFEFTRRNRSAMANSAAAASVVMKGVIRSVDLQTISTRGRDVAGERRVALTVDVQLVKPSGEVGWAVKNLTDNEAFRVTNDKFANDDLQRAALGIVATRIAERIYSRLTDEF